MKFHWKLMSSYLAIIVLLSAFFYFSFDHSAKSVFMEESRENLISQTRLAKLLAEQDAIGLPPQMLAENVGSAVKARVTLIQPDGRVIADSDVKRPMVAELENHLSRPEVQQALKTGIGSAVRYSDTLKTSMLYTAISYNSAGKKGVIRLSQPLEYFNEASQTLHRVTGTAMLLSALLALGLSLFLSKLTSRPLREMAALAERIGKDKDPIRIPVSGHDEIGLLASVMNDMAGRIDRQLQSLAAEKLRLDTILKGMGEGVMVATSKGTITLVNPSFRNMFGITADVEGRNLIEVSRNPDLQAAFQELSETGNELIREIRILPGETTLLTHWVPLPANNGGDGVVAVFHDITDMKYVENMRRDFVANVSHELRTPVSVIKGYAETLLMEGVIASEPDKASRFAGIIHNHAERLTILINDILTLSYLESKAAALELNPLDVGGTAAKACMLLAQNAAAKCIKLANEVPSGQLPRIMADQGRLEQVLVNLIDNAIKYTPVSGTVRVYAEQAPGQLKLSVTDSGIGIPEKDLPRIFERFYRVDAARSREQGGTGLGLSIAKHIVQLHGGELTVTSTPGKGSTFTCTLRTA
ncbi:MAG TPA: ATP-binding protein [Deltaproteobacteria bacterium]|nr:ATP-binding protein [Deltaproteobacteria bacterium]